jgi:hypothetical protein
MAEDDVDELPMSEEDEKALNEELAKQKDEGTTDPRIDTKIAQAKLKSIAEIEADLSKPIPPRLLKTMPGRGGGKQLSYIHWLTAQKFLSLYAPGWSSRVTFVDPVGDEEKGGVVVGVEVSIPTQEGIVTRGNVGYKAYKTGKDKQTGEAKDTGFGGAALVAQRQAFKRAAADFGLARGLYEK